MPDVTGMVLTSYNYCLGDDRVLSSIIEYVLIIH